VRSGHLDQLRRDGVAACLTKPIAAASLCAAIAAALR